LITNIITVVILFALNHLITRTIENLATIVIKAAV